MGYIPVAPNIQCCPRILADIWHASAVRVEYRSASPIAELYRGLSGGVSAEAKFRSSTRLQRDVLFPGRMKKRVARETWPWDHPAKFLHQGYPALYGGAVILSPKAVRGVMKEIVGHYPAGIKHV